MDAPRRIELPGRLRPTQGERVVTRFRARLTGALLAYLGYYHGEHGRSLQFSNQLDRILNGQRPDSDAL